MNRQILYSFLAIAIFATCCTIGTAQKPNVMIVFADDVGTGDVPGYWENSGLVAMPNLENFVETGTTFTDAHSTPLCAPSRYVLLSGNYQHRGAKYAGSWTVNYEGNQFRSDQKSIAQVLRESGYITSMVGKWHLGGKVPLRDGVSVHINDTPNKMTMLSNTKHDWSKPMEQGPWDIGFDHSYISLAGLQNPPYAFLRNNILELDKSDIKFWNVGNYSMPHGLSKIDKAGEGSPDWDSTGYNMILVNETEKFLDDYMRNNSSSPFFSYVALGAVHTPHSPPDKYLDGTKVAGEHDTPHMDVLAELDLVFGSLTSMLQKRNLMNNTIIIFASDNGGLGMDTGSASELSGHRSGGTLRAEKKSIYEGGHRIPLTIRWDGGFVPRGEKRSHLVGLNDLFATICDLVEVPVPNSQAHDSVSFKRYLFDENRKYGLRKSLGNWSFRKDKNIFRLNYEAVRVGSMKLIHNYQNETFELYDLSNDISEEHNLIDEVDPLEIDKMYSELRKIGPCHDRRGKFFVKKRAKKVSCSWFARKQRPKRCAKFDGYIYCRMTCALRSSNQCEKISAEA